MSKKKDNEPNELILNDRVARKLGFDPVEEKDHVPKGITERPMVLEPGETLADRQTKEAAESRVAELKRGRVPTRLRFVGPDNVIHRPGPVTRKEKLHEYGVKKLQAGDEFDVVTKEAEALEHRYKGCFERVGD